jgi:DNA-binding SARP family transcriptional activator
MLEIRLLGEPEFWLGSDRVHPKLRPRCVSLLAYLACHRDRAHTRAAVAASLWPDELEEDARSNLRRHLHLLASALPKLESPLFEDEGRMLQWSAQAPVRVDVIEFERNAASTGTFADAVGLYRGEFLRGWDDEWIFDVREAFRVRLIDMLLALGSQAMRRGDFDRAVDCADRLLAQDEWREDAIRLKMSAMYCRGDRLGSLSVYDRFAETLQREMRVEPTLDTAALRTAILANAPLATLHPEGEDSTGATTSAFALPFVGRETELSRLRSAWNRAARGSGTTIFVQGEAGIGKSRLARQLALLAERQGGCVLSGVTSNPQAQPYQAVVGALRRGLPYLAHATIDDVWLGALGDLLPEVYGLRPNLAVPEPLDPASAEPRLVEAFARAFGAIARAKPLLLILEDIQWAGDGTLAMFSALARRCAALPMLIVATVRTADVENPAFIGARSGLVSEHRASIVSLSALATKDFDGVSEIPSDVLARAAHVGGGNPLFVTLLLQAYLETGTVPAGSEAVRTVGDAIALRLHSLSDLARTVAQAGAVAGHSFDAPLIARITGWDDAQVYEAIDALLDGGIVRESNASFQYTFTHALIERALYDSLDDETRALRHRRIAAILDQGDDPRQAAIIADHWAKAGRREPARAAYERAVQHALSVYAWSEATRHARSALALFELDDDRFRLLLLLANSSRDANPAAREEVVAMLEALAARVGTPEAQMEALKARIDLVRHSGNRARQRQACDELIATANAARSRKYALQGLAALGMYQLDVAQVAQCEVTLREVLASLQPGDFSPEREAAFRTQLGHALMRLGRLDEAVGVANELRSRLSASQLGELRYAIQLQAAIAIARRSTEEARSAAREMLEIDAARGDIVQLAVSHAYLASCSDAFPQVAREHYREALELATATQHRVTVMMVHLNRAQLEEQLGRFDLALADARRARTLAHDFTETTAEAHALINESAALRETGEVRAALEQAKEALNLIRELNEPRVLGASLAAIGAAQLAAGETAAAIETLDAAVAHRRRSHSIGQLISDLVRLAEALMRANRIDEARVAADEVAALASGEISDELRPAKLCAVLAEVYRASRDDVLAQTWTERGRSTMQTMLERIPDEETRAAYRGLSCNRF